MYYVVYGVIVVIEALYFLSSSYVSKSTKSSKTLETIHYNDENNMPQTQLHENVLATSISTCDSEHIEFSVPLSVMPLVKHLRDILKVIALHPSSPSKYTITFI